MKEELFKELLESVHEGEAILRGNKQPSRKFTFENPDVQQLLADYQLSQKDCSSKRRK